MVAFLSIAGTGFSDYFGFADQPATVAEASGVKMIHPLRLAP
jgi:hypothetical protein